MMMNKTSFCSKSILVEDRDDFSSVHFIEVICSVVASNKDEAFASWYNSDGQLIDQRTFRQIWEKAGLIAYHLRRKWNLSKGERVVLCYDFGLHFLEVFFGCLRAGVVAVLVYPPGPPLKKSLLKLHKVISDCNPALILTDSRVNGLRLLDKSNPLSKSRSLWPKNLRFQVTDKLHQKSGLSLVDEQLAGSDIAFLQYTSGSTGDPKGVMVTFDALKANVKLLRDGFHDCYFKTTGYIPKKIVGFSWLPQYHDLGLIYALITPFAAGWEMHMISPISFIQKPLLWLELMSKHKCSWSIAPNFSYQLVTRKFMEARLKTGKEPIPGLDLSNIVHLANAAEPIRIDTKEMFENAFNQYGLPEKWFIAGYGLAEHVVGVSYMDGQILSKERPDDKMCYVAVGSKETFHDSLTVKIVDPETRQEVGDSVTGEVWLGGPSVAAGYYNKQELSDAVFRAKIQPAENNRDVENQIHHLSFLRTGDLGFFQDDKLFICGRSKDLIIYNGVNYYPQDLEFAAQEANTSVRPGCVAAFAASDIEDGLTIQVVFEVRRGSYTEAKNICSEVRNAILQSIGIPVKDVVAIEERSIPKTTSGKIQRRATREALQNGTLKVIALVQNDENESSAEQVELDIERGQDIPATPTKNAVLDGSTKESVCTILASMLGDGFNETSTWEELGMSSIAVVEFQNLVSDRLSYQLPLSFQEDFRTPRDLRLHLESWSCSRIMFEVRPFEGENNVTQCYCFSWILLSALQAIGICLQLMVISFSFVPAYQFGRLIVSNNHLNITTDKIQWQWLPFVVPTWMLSFSFCIVVCKWVIVGRYTERAIVVPSFQYLQWWFVDRLVHIWEVWVGRFIKDTPIIWLFYWLLGAQIHPSVALNAYVREFDLVKIGRHSKLKHDITCRRFRPWLENKPLQLVFRTVQIGDCCVIEGLISPGGLVGDGSDLEKLSSVGEGAVVPKHIIAKASPAYGILKPEGSNVMVECLSFTDQVVFGSAKVCWLLVELYIFATLLLFSQWIMEDRLPVEFRYTPLFYWSLVLVLQTILSAITMIALKWLILGKRVPGGFKSSYSLELREWIVDYHYRLTLVVLDVIDNSKLANLYLKALGMDIDWTSHIWACNIEPSQMDLVTLKNSFLSWTSFDTKVDEQRQKIEIYDSSFGHTCQVKGGTCVKNAQIAPLSIVQGESVLANVDSVAHGAGGALQFSWMMEFMYLMYLAAIVFSTIPAFELFRLDWGDQARLGFSVSRFALVLALQTVVWLLLLRSFQCVVLQRGKVVSVQAFPVSMSAVSPLLFNLSMLGLAQGTCYFNAYLRLMGAKIDGKILCFPRSLYDCPLLTFSDRTILDRCTVSGHSVEHGQLIVGPTMCSGVLHEMTFVVANTDMSQNNSIESGPYRFVTPNCGSGIDRLDLQKNSSAKDVLLMTKHSTDKESSGSDSGEV